jgi:hypothetical protein
MSMKAALAEEACRQSAGRRRRHGTRWWREAWEVRRGQEERYDGERNRKSLRAETKKKKKGNLERGRGGEESGRRTT